MEDLANKAPIVRFVNLVLFQAVQDRASDIHFEPFETEFRIRYRVDGALYEMSPPPKQLALPVVSRLKVMANLNISERRLPQDGGIHVMMDGRPVDLKASASTDYPLRADIPMRPGPGGGDPKEREAACRGRCGGGPVLPRQKGHSEPERFLLRL